MLPVGLIGQHAWSHLEWELTPQARRPPGVDPGDVRRDLVVQVQRVIDGALITQLNALLRADCRRLLTHEVFATVDGLWQRRAEAYRRTDGIGVVPLALLGP